MGSSSKIWALRCLFLYLCSYNLVGSVTISPSKKYLLTCSLVACFFYAMRPSFHTTLHRRPGYFPACGPHPTPRCPTPPCRRGHPLPRCPTLARRYRHPPPRPTPRSPVAATRRRSSSARTASPAIGQRHHDRKKRMLQAYVSSVLDVWDVCCKCFVRML
jgi:hypothetical protein